MPVPFTREALAACALLIAAPTAAQAASSWSAAADVPGSTGAATPVVAGLADGSAAVLFTKPTDPDGDDPAPVWLARRTATQPFASVAVPSGSTTAEPVVSVAADGSLLGAYLAPSGSSTGIDVVRGTLSGGAPSRVALSAATVGASPSDVAVAALPGVGGVVLWTATDPGSTDSTDDDVRRVYGVTVTSTAVTPAVTLSAAADGDASGVVAGSAGGQFLATWVTASSTEATSGTTVTTTTSSRIRGVRGPVLPGASFVLAGPVRRVATESTSPNVDTTTAVGESFASLDLDVAPSGAALLAYSLDDVNDREDPDGRADVLRFTPFGSRGSVAGGLGVPVAVQPAPVPRPDEEGSPDDAGVRAGAGDGPAAISFLVNGTAALRGLGPDGAVTAARDGLPAFEADPFATAGGVGVLTTADTTVVGSFGAQDTPLSTGLPASPGTVGRTNGALAVWQNDVDPRPTGDEVLRSADLTVTPDPSPPGPDPTPTPPTTTTAPTVPPTTSTTTTPPPPPPPAPEADVTKPVIAGLTVSPSRFRVGSGGVVFATRATGGPRGGRITFSLSEPARVQLTVSRLLIRPGGKIRCTGVLRRAAPRTVGRVGMVRQDRPAGPTSVAFSGRVDGKALPRGRYVVRARAADRAANLSPIASAAFSVC